MSLTADMHQPCRQGLHKSYYALRIEMSIASYSSLIMAVIMAVIIPLFIQQRSAQTSPHATHATKHAPHTRRVLKRQLLQALTLPWNCQYGVLVCLRRHHATQATG
jgi:hypothetical protein